MTVNDALKRFVDAIVFEPDGGRFVEFTGFVTVTGVTLCRDGVIIDAREVARLRPGEGMEMLQAAFVAAVYRGEAGDGRTLYWGERPVIDGNRFSARLRLSD